MSLQKLNKLISIAAEEVADALNKILGSNPEATLKSISKG